MVIRARRSGGKLVPAGQSKGLPNIAKIHKGQSVRLPNGETGKIGLDSRGRFYIGKKWDLKIHNASNPFLVWDKRTSRWVKCHDFQQKGSVLG